MLSDDDVEFLAEVAERVAKRDAEGPPG